MTKEIQAKRDSLSKSYQDKRYENESDMDHYGVDVCFGAGFDAGYAAAKEEKDEAVHELVTAVKRRMASDDSCGHPFDEDLAEALKPFDQEDSAK